MKNLEDLYGFRIVYCLDENSDEKNVEITNFPHFPDETKQSKNLFDQIEKHNFNSRKIPFPIELNITERLVEISPNLIEIFNIDDLFDIIEKDKDRFINTDTFFKVKLIYENKKPFISVDYYTISKNGTTKIDDIDKLLDFISVDYDKKKITKKFITPRVKKNQEEPNDIEHIPILPLLWLDYDEKNNLIYFNHFRLIKVDKLPF